MYCNRVAQCLSAAGSPKLGIGASLGSANTSLYYDFPTRPLLGQRVLLVEHSLPERVLLLIP